MSVLTRSRVNNTSGGPRSYGGTRLQPLTENKPKGFVEVADKPTATHWFDRVLKAAKWSRQ